MLIGRLENNRLDFKLGYKTLFSVPVRQFAFIHGGRLGELTPHNCEFLVRELMNCMQRERADVVFFNHLRTDSALYKAVTRLPGFFSRDHIHSTMIHRAMALPAAKEDVYKGLSSKVRKNLKWQAKKLLGDFPDLVEVRTFTRAEELDRMIRDVEGIAERTYQRGLRVGFVDSPEMRQRLLLESERGWLRAHVLYISGKPAAFWIGDVYGETFHSNFMGYDAEFARIFCRMFLIMKTIESLLDPCGTAKTTQIDFGLGDAQYKEVLGTSSWEEDTPRIFAPTITGFCLNMLWGSTMLLSQMAHKVLDRADLVQKIKKTWRDRLRTRLPESSPASSPVLDPRRHRT